VGNHNVVSWKPREAFHSFGDEDKFLVDFFNKKNGYLIDIGAADGVTGSLSYKLLNSLSWKGILIEPIPMHVEQLKKLYSGNKNIKISEKAVFANKDEVDFTLFEYANIGLSHIKDVSDYPDLSNIKSKLIKIKGDTIINILHENNCPEEIDYVKIDVEGSESYILDNWDFTKYKVKLFCIENGEKYFNFFIKNNYVLLIPKVKKYFFYQHNFTKKIWKNFGKLEIPTYDFVHGNAFYIEKKYINNFITKKFTIKNS
jgi:FkbM family methyltransferase